MLWLSQVHEHTPPLGTQQTWKLNIAKYSSEIPGRAQKLLYFRNNRGGKIGSYRSSFQGFFSCLAIRNVVLMRKGAQWQTNDWFSLEDPNAAVRPPFRCPHIAHCVYLSLRRGPQNAPVSESFTREFKNILWCFCSSLAFPLAYHHRSTPTGSHCFSSSPPSPVKRLC